MDAPIHALPLAFGSGADGIAELPDWKAISGRIVGDGWLWVHFDVADPEARRWLEEQSGVPASGREALLAGETRPRQIELDEGDVLILRGVNLNPGAELEDMVSLRIWIDAHRMISSSRRRLRAVGDLGEQLRSGTAPLDSIGLLTMLVRNLLARIEPALDQLSDEVDEIEDEVSAANAAESHPDLADLRRRIIALRRHLAPQRDALDRLAHQWRRELDSPRVDILGHRVDQATRAVEELDELRERTAIVHDLFTAAQTETLNRRMYVLALVTTVFVPLGLLTGLLGINVAGIPGAADPLAFWIVCAVLVGLAGGLFWALKRQGWF